MIMPTTTVDFQEMADAIAADFFERGVPLAEGCAARAKERNLVPEEVRRLVERTNTTASLRLLRASEDKKGTFDLARTEDVLEKTHPAADAAEDTPEYKGFPEDASVDAASDSGDAAPFSGDAEKGEEQRKEASAVGMAEIFTLRREIEERKLLKAAAESDVRRDLDSLASEFFRWEGPDFGKFAADCMAAYGEVCVPVLEGLASYMGASVPNAKTAESTEDVIDDTTPHMRAMRGICDGLSGVVKLGREIGEMQAALEYFTNDLRRAALRR